MPRRWLRSTTTAVLSASPVRSRLDAGELRGLVTKITTQVPPVTPIQAVMEPTGMSWFPVARWLNDAGVEVIRVKGQRVKALRKYLSEHAKTDIADAHLLGTLPSIGSLRLQPLHVPSPRHHALQRLTKQRQRYQDLRSSSKRRLLDLIRWACPKLETALPGLLTELSLAVRSATKGLGLLDINGVPLAVAGATACCTTATF